MVMIYKNIFLPFFPLWRLSGASEKGLEWWSSLLVTVELVLARLCRRHVGRVRARINLTCVFLDSSDFWHKIHILIIFFGLQVKEAPLKLCEMGFDSDE